MSPWLGVVADDVTGAVDLAGEVGAAGLRTVVVLGVPDDGADLPGCDCAVVALTTRTAPVAQAVEDSTAAARWLLGHGARWLYQKYCSTFDSTDAGNIGPVADALAGLVGGRSVGTPATPAVGRTQYLRQLFVGDRLLSESSLRDHPLTPMRDPDLVRVLGRQTRRAVAAVPWPVVRAGARSVREAVGERFADGAAHVLVDALTDADLDVLATAVTADVGGGPSDPGAARPLLGGAAGFATALARLHTPTLASTTSADLPPVGHGPSLVVAGSCSERTREQVARHPGPRLRISAPDLAAGVEEVVSGAVEFLVRSWSQDQASVPAVLSTADPDQVRAEQDAVGREESARLVEGALGEIARRAVHDHGARRVLVAGGETSGAVTAALGVGALHVGRRVEPGLAWTVTTTEPAIALLLKSGNFGSPDLFTTAWEASP